jgi:hypothetical protein
MVTDTGMNVGYALRVVIPVVYIFVGIISIVCNLIALQYLCTSRIVHKALHLFLCSIIVQDICFVVIFVVVRTVSYAYLSATWFLNVQSWCKAEMYLLRLFDFVLAYTIVAMCFDRLFSSFCKCVCIRQLRTGFATVTGIWLFSAYILIPILLFQQNISIEAYGGYLCYTVDSSVTLNWLNANPRRALDFIDFIFRIVFPIFLMVLCQLAVVIKKAVVTYQNKRKAKYETVGVARKQSKVSVDALIANVTVRKIKIMILSYCCLFLICQSPYEIYRAVLTWNSSLEYNLRNQRMDFAIELPLLLLKLVNRTINPFLVICMVEDEHQRLNFCRLPCFPRLSNLKNCWCLGIGQAIKSEIKNCFGLRKEKDDKWIPTGYQTINTSQYVDGTMMVTKKIIREEYETGVEPYYKNSKENMVNTDDWVIVSGRDKTQPNTTSRDVEFRPNSTSTNSLNQQRSFVTRME